MAAATGAELDAEDAEPEEAEAEEAVTGLRAAPFLRFSSHCGKRNPKETGRSGKETNNVY